MRWLFHPAVVGALLLTALSATADYPWFFNVPFVALGLYLGWRKGKAGVGAIGGLVAGAIATSPLVWIVLAPLQAFLDDELTISRVLERAIVSFLAAVVGFFIVLYPLGFIGSYPAVVFTVATLVAITVSHAFGLYVLIKR